MRGDMSPDEFAREMLCSFQAPVEGAYYQEALNALQMQKRVCRVAPDLKHQRHHRAGILGIRHLQVIWLFQVCGRELHWLDYIEGRAKVLAIMSSFSCSRRRLAASSTARISCRTMSRSRSWRRATAGGMSLTGLLKEPVFTVPNHSTEDGITATRGCWGIWFDEERRGRVGPLRSYRRGKTGMAVADEAGGRGGCVSVLVAVGHDLWSAGGFLAARHGGAGRLRRRLGGGVMDIGVAC